MKTIFSSKNRGKTFLYILFALAVLSFVALIFCSSLLPEDIYPLALLITLAGMMFSGSLIIQMRSSAPW